MIFDDYMTEKFKVIFNYDGINEFNIDNNNIIINILNKQDLDKAKHGPRYKFITKNNNDFEVKVNSEFNGNFETIPEKLNHNQKRILKKCKDKIIKSNDLVYKYSTQELDLNNSKLIEMEIKNVWKQN